VQNYKIDLKLNKEVIIKVIREIATLKKERQSSRYVEKIVRKNPKVNGGFFSKASLIKGYKKYYKELHLNDKERQVLLNLIKMKRVRSISGVTTVTVLTKPFPCPGKCIFCPNDVRMPKSYLSEEPGAQRAESNLFDPYLQVFNRLVAYKNIGHNTDKIELIVLGGTWSSYPKTYQIWFLKRCFEALNGFDQLNNPERIDPNKFEDTKGKLPFEEKTAKKIAKSLYRERYKTETSTWEELEEQHKINETAKTRCVGLVLETRPDEINKEEIINIRRLGATKIQIGVQSLNDEVLKLNKRGHEIRSAGFKIHAHYMPNLLGSTPEKDILDFEKMYSEKSFRPDEIKIYPCSLVHSAELMQYYKRKEWMPYSTKELTKVVQKSISIVPEYCRITRVIRDISGKDIVIGNKTTNLRQVAERENKATNIKMKDIRSREIKDRVVKMEDLEIKITEYKTNVSEEHFIQYITNDGKEQIAAFLRLSIPKANKHIIEELNYSTIIREVHVYGVAVDIGEKEKGKAQHLGLGKKMIKLAEEISKKNKFNRIAVISSIGTRGYYSKLGYDLEKLYQSKSI